MSEFRKLIRHLQQELSKQEKLLTVLAAEREAIIKLNQEEIEILRDKKEKIIDSARLIEGERKVTLERITENAEQDGPLKLAQIVELCPEKQVKRDLESVGAKLKEVAYEVSELNSHNGILIKQTLGIVASVASIFRSGLETDLPAYEKSGKLSGDQESPFATRSGGALAREV